MLYLAELLRLRLNDYLSISYFRKIVQLVGYCWAHHESVNENCMFGFRSCPQWLCLSQQRSGNFDFAQRMPIMEDILRQAEVPKIIIFAIDYSSILSIWTIGLLSCMHQIYILTLPFPFVYGFYTDHPHFTYYQAWNKWQFLFLVFVRCPVSMAAVVEPLGGLWFRAFVLCETHNFTWLGTLFLAVCRQ